MREKYRRPHRQERVQAVERMKRDWQAQREALDVVRRFNSCGASRRAMLAATVTAGRASLRWRSGRWFDPRARR
jgi:hypothetical protein